MNWDKKSFLAIVVAILVVAGIGKITSILSTLYEKSIAAPHSKTERANQPITQTKQIMEIKVRSGWCLSRISEGLGTNVKDLVELNGIKNPDLIYAGQILKVVPYNRTNEVEVSWYGSAFHGRKMSNGKTFNMYDSMTAAHKLLPFNTKVKLTRVDNQKSITITIRDRGPYIKGRHFDLSYAAAKKLGVVNIGLARCKVEVLN